MEIRRGKMEDISAANGSDNVVEMFCEHCYDQGQHHVTAEGFCVNCVKYFCSTCLRHHGVFLPDHVQQDKNSMPTDFYTEKCNNHPQQLLKFYCITCEATACITCKTELHTKCKDIHHLPRLIADFDKDKQCGDLERVVDRFEKEAKDMKASIKGYRQNVDQQNADVIKEVKDQKKEVEKIFNDFEKEIDKHHKANRDTLNDLEDKTNDLLKKDIQNLKSEIRQLKNSEQKCKIYLKTKKLLEQKQQLWKKLKSEKDRLKKDLHWYLYQKAQGQIKSETFGKVTSETKVVVKGNKDHSYNKVLCFMAILILVCAIIFVSPNLAKHILTKTSLSTMNNAFIKQTSNITLEKLSEINLESLFLLHSKVKYICYLSEHILFLIEGETVFVYDPINMKHIQSSFQPEIVLIKKLNDKIVGAISREHIEFWNIGSHRSGFDKIVVKSYYTGLYCPDIVYCAGNLFTLCYDKEFEQTLMNMYDTNGEKVRSFTTKNGYRMTVSPDCKTIFTSNWFTVTSYTTEGKLIAEYQDDSLRGPDQMTVDSKGNLFVHGYYSYNIFYISPDLKHGYELYHISNSYRNSISYSETDDTLCINPVDSKSITLFKIKRFIKFLNWIDIEI